MSDEIDAKRYRWLREHMTYKDLGTVVQDDGKLRYPMYRRWYHDSPDLVTDSLDNLIDRAMTS